RHSQPTERRAPARPKDQQWNTTGSEAGYFLTPKIDSPGASGITLRPEPASVDRGLESPITSRAARWERPAVISSPISWCS
ncbi:hypothetical protein M3D92_13080, partial [Micrococcus terreus]|uniref:hypothetical protein n=1 Tax=Micrococcus terreus TaxID=574650 RepID=UPI0021A53502